MGVGTMAGDFYAFSREFAGLDWSAGLREREKG
jgi:hypothetical protein